MEWVAGCATIACVLWIRHKETQLWSGNLVVRLGKYAPSAACLLVYLVGYALAPLFGVSSSGLGVDLACGALGAAWCITGWKKLQLSGVRWMSTQSIGLLIAEGDIGPPIPGLFVVALFVASLAARHRHHWHRRRWRALLFAFHLFASRTPLRLMSS